MSHDAGGEEEGGVVEAGEGPEQTGRLVGLEATHAQLPAAQANATRRIDEEGGAIFKAWATESVVGERRAIGGGGNGGGGGER